MNTVIFVTSNLNDADNGPTVYARYLYESLSHQLFNFVVLSCDADDAQRGQVSFSPGSSSKEFYSNLEEALFLYIDKHPEDHIILHLNIPHLVSKLPACKTVVQANDYDAAIILENLFDSYCKYGLRRLLAMFWRRFREKKVFRSCDVIVANSRYTGSSLADYYNLPDDKFRLIYKAVDLNFFSAPDASKPEALTSATKFNPSRPFRILFVGSNWQRKGLDTLFEALSILPKLVKNIDVTVVGPEHFEASTRIKKMIERSDISSSFEFVGRTPRDKVLSYYQCADICVLPSRAEALGVAVIEALACGLPVIATNVGGIPEILEGEKAGLLIEPDAPEELASEIEKLYSNPGLLASMSDMAIARAREFSTERMVSKVKSLYLEIFESDE